MAEAKKADSPSRAERIESLAREIYCALVVSPSAAHKTLESLAEDAWSKARAFFEDKYGVDRGQ